MNVLPVITRELRAQARQPFTYAMRMLGVLALLGGGFVFAVDKPFASNLGGALFSYLHFTLLFAIWVLVPLSAADCISRERREGTLGLLFLTPLKATDIVIAKGLAHGLRAATLWVAVLPVLTIPFLLGGVSWQQAAVSAIVSFSSICWALAAALVSSSGNRRSLRAMIGAVVFAIFGLFTFAVITGFLVRPTFSGPLSRLMSNADYTLLLGLGSVGVNPGRGGLLRALPFGPPLWGMAQSAVFSLVTLAGAILLAAWRIRRTWRDEPPPVWVRWWQRRFCTPVVGVGFFRRWMRWKLQRNPIGWLEQRTWQGRLVTWSWFAIIISIYSAVLTDPFYFHRSSSFQILLSWLLMGSIASSAAGSFRRERETGVLELFLVAPLTTGQIIEGRLRGLWGQFLPAVGILLGIWFYFVGLFKQWEDLRWIWYFAITFLALPVIGLYFSLRCRNFLSAFLLALSLGLGVPAVLGWLVEMTAWILSENFGGSGPFKWSFRAFMSMSAGQLALALLLGWRLHRRLANRSFPLERVLA